MSPCLAQASGSALQYDELCRVVISENLRLTYPSNSPAHRLIIADNFNDFIYFVS